RNRSNTEKQKLGKEVIDKMIELWKNFYPEEIGPDRYIAALLMNNHSGLVFHHFVDKDYISMDVQLAIEMIQGIAQNEKNDTYAPVALNAFLYHKSPNVVIQALRTISRKESYAEELDNSILNETALNIGVEDHVRLAGFNTSPNAKKYIKDLLTIGTEDPYLQPLRYAALKKVWDESKVFDYMIADIDTSDGLLYSTLLTELNNLWANADDELKSQERNETVNEVLFSALEKGARTFLMHALYSDENVLNENDFETLLMLLENKSVEDDSDVFRSVTSVLKNRFEERSEEVITQLYQNAGNELKETIIAQEWSFIEDSLAPVTFRTPDWDRLADLGPNPIWVLDTKKGDIEITLDVLTAPATISGMDSLIRNGDYTGVAFHRVVPNFVIQGGDVETGRGFGGPDYTVPTEASAAHYFRGKAGVASSGPDTEGSQYFFMHVWGPHLNGRYTIFGEVTKGMSVVDRITQGDVVRNSYWK
ncbi:MAG: peptidylprolyl isomerase, partial [Balneola sp.]